MSVLVEEMKSEDTEARIAAMRKLRTIARALGPERTRKDLIPFLNGTFAGCCCGLLRVELCACTSCEPVPFHPWAV